MLFNGWYNKIKNIFSDESEITYETFKGYFQSDISFCGQLDNLNRNFYKLYYAYKGEAGNSTTDYYKNKITTTLTLKQDMVLYGNVLMSANVNLNGHTLTIYGNLRQTAGYMYINGGKLNVTGDYKIQVQKEDGSTGDSSGTLNMLTDEDYVYVGGDFYQYYGASSNFQALSTHNVIFKGTVKHTVYFQFTNSNFATVQVHKSPDYLTLSRDNCYTNLIVEPCTYNETITKQPNISEEGEKTYTCTICGDTYTETIPKVEPAKVTGVTAVYQDGQIVLTWEDTGAVQYRVMRYDVTSGYSTLTFRATAPEGSYACLKYNIEETTYTDTSIPSTGTYRYKVVGYYKAVDGNWVYGDLSDTLFVTIE